MVDESPREKAAERQEMALAALRYDLGTARPLKEIVLHALRSGARPEYIAMRYGHLKDERGPVTLERVLAAKAWIEREKKAVAPGAATV